MAAIACSKNDFWNDHVVPLVEAVTAGTVTIPPPTAEGNPAWNMFLDLRPTADADIAEHIRKALEYGTVSAREWKKLDTKKQKGEKRSAVKSATTAGEPGDDAVEPPKVNISVWFCLSGMLMPLCFCTNRRKNAPRST